MNDKLGMNPWLEIWVRPRQTIRAILNYNSGYLFPLLCWIYGFPMLLQAAQNLSLGDRFSMGAILIGCLVLAIVPGYLMINLMAGLLYWTGKWIGGKGSFEEVRGAVTWSSAPSVVTIAIWVINLLMFGKFVFSAGFVLMPIFGGQLAMVAIISILQLVVAIWAFIILLKTVAEAQLFSAWKGLLNVIIPLAIIFIGASLLVWFLSFVTGGPQINIPMK